MINKAGDFIRNNLIKIVVGIVVFTGFILDNFYVSRAEFEDYKTEQSDKFSTLQKEADTLKVKFRMYIGEEKIKEVNHDFVLDRLNHRFSTFKSETEIFIQNERVSFNLLENDVIRLQERIKK